LRLEMWRMCSTFHAWGLLWPEVMPLLKSNLLNFLCCRGKAASEQYNVRQRYNTLQYSILPALIKAPWGFEEAVRLYYTSKAQVVKAQARAWAKMDKPSQLPAAHRGPMYGPSEGPVKTKEAAGAVVAAIDGLMREQEGR